MPKKKKQEGEAEETKTTKSKSSSSKKQSAKNSDKNLIVFIVGAIIILGIVGILFGYTKDKFSQLVNYDSQKEKSMEKQMNQLKNEIEQIKEKAEALEKENEYNKDVVIDLFDQNRTIPRSPNVLDWKILADDELSFAISYPNNWEALPPVIEEVENDDASFVQESLYLQPTGQTQYVNAVTIKTDYSDFSGLSLSEKKIIFNELDDLDTYDFADGTMIYFINIDKDNNEIPTILILTDDNIYRATFNIKNKRLQNYFMYRETFENIVSTFMAREVDRTASVSPEETEE